MKPILQQLYLSAIEDNEIVLKKQYASKEELEACRAIDNTLTKEQKKLFDTHEEVSAKRYMDAAEEMYYLGFKMGVKLMLEIIDREIDVSNASDP